MKEKILQYIWNNKKFNFINLKTIKGQEIEIIKTGTLNTNQGADFLDAEIKINDLIWKGNIEIHVKSSDYYLHKHQNRKEYQKIILHVVYYNDLIIDELESKNIPTLELKDHVNKNLIKKMKSLQNDLFNFIPCEHLLLSQQNYINKGIIQVYNQKINNKEQEIIKYLHFFKGNWEAVLFTYLCYSFGLKINSDNFILIAKEIDFSIIQKNIDDNIKLEALFLGFFNELENPKDQYQAYLKQEYDFISHKYNITKNNYTLNYFRLRPTSFPTLRLSQLANLYTKNKKLFSLLIEEFSYEKFSNILSQVKSSDYWENHYIFGKLTKKNNTNKLSKTIIDSIFINSIVYIKFAYDKYLGKNSLHLILENLENIKKENNVIINSWESLNFKINNSLETQSLLYLHKEYCLNKKCLECPIGIKF